MLVTTLMFHYSLMYSTCTDFHANRRVAQDTLGSCVSQKEHTCRYCSVTVTLSFGRVFIVLRTLSLGSAHTLSLLCFGSEARPVSQLPARQCVVGRRLVSRKPWKTSVPNKFPYQFHLCCANVQTAPLVLVSLCITIHVGPATRELGH